MKIRNGFVSNSSSSSFLIYGVCLDPDEMREAITKNAEEFSSILEDYEITLESLESEEVDDYDLGSIIEKYLSLKDSRFESHRSEYDGTYFGISWADIKDHETGRQFKDNIEKILSPISEDISTHEEAWYNG